MVKSKLTLTFTFFRLKFYCLEHFLWELFGQSLKILCRGTRLKQIFSKKVKQNSQKNFSLNICVQWGPNKNSRVDVSKKKVNEGSSQVCVNQLQIEFNQRGDPFFYFIRSFCCKNILSFIKQQKTQSLYHVGHFCKQAKSFKYFLRLLSSRWWCGCLKWSAQLQEKPLVYLVTRRLVIQVSLGWMLWSVDSACCLIADTLLLVRS